jgi:hypothetical protein
MTWGIFSAVWFVASMVLALVYGPEWLQRFLMVAMGMVALAAVTVIAFLCVAVLVS